MSMPRGVAADDSGATYIRPPVFFWTLDQIDTMLAVPSGWTKRNSRVAGDRINGPGDRAKIVTVDITPNEDAATWRVRHEELIRFCRRRGIAFVDNI